MNQGVFGGMGMTMPECVDKAILRLQTFFQPGCNPAYVGFSGGKDSIVVAQLCKEAGIPYQLYMAVTTMDSPELLQFVKRHYPETTWVKSDKGRPMWASIAYHRWPPTGRSAWCCEEYKHCHGGNRRTITGIRAEESAARGKRWSVVTNFKHGKDMREVVCPIIDWSTEHVWEFIRDRGLAYPSLYDEGFDRLGCIGCPKAGRNQMLMEFERWPKFEHLWKKGIRMSWEKAQVDGQHTTFSKFKRWEDVWEWWLKENKDPSQNPCDFGLFG